MKPDKFSITDLAAVLNPVDKAYCDNLFQKYEKLRIIATEIFNDGDGRLLDYNNEPHIEKEHPFAKDLVILRSYMGKIASAVDETTRSLVRRMESYFEEKYDIKFTSLLKSDSYNMPPIMTDYEAIIANMINKTGRDFSKEKP